MNLHATVVSLAASRPGCPSAAQSLPASLLILIHQQSRLELAGLFLRCLHGDPPKAGAQVQVLRQGSVPVS